MVTKNEAIDNYSASSITTLEGLEAVRKRPAMYIGNTASSGLAHLVFEIFDNSIDEVLGDFADTITMTFYSDNSVSIEDNGRGIPPEALETIFTTLHSGGKFDSSNYKSSGGLHGVGTSVTNAMSEWLEVTVFRNGKNHKLRFEQGGKPVSKLEITKAENKQKTGTYVHFKPDATLFSTIKFNVERIEQRARESAFLNPNVKIIFNDFRSEDVEEQETKVFDYQGMEDYLNYLKGTSDISVNPQTFVGEDTTSGMEMTVAIQWQEGEDTQENILSYVNNIRTRDGGTHETGFKTGLTKAFNQYGKDLGLLKGKYNRVLGEDIRDGLIAVISVKIPENILEFTSQTKDKLGTDVARSVLDNFIFEKTLHWLMTNKSDAEYLIERAIKYQKMKEEAKRLRDTTKKGAKAKKTAIDPMKLTEPNTKDYKKRELFIVEGASASGCIAIDTKIKLANGTDKTVGELLEDFKNGKDNYVYGFDDKNGTGFNAYKILDVFKTKTNTQVLRVTFDDGTKIRVTPDHLFLLRNGNWRQAKDLYPQHSLRAIYLNESKKGHLSNPYNSAHFKETFIHQGVARKYHGEIPEGYLVHHKDENKHNNYPDNLEIMSFSEHSTMHSKKHMSENEEARNRLANTHIERFNNDPEYRANNLERLAKVQEEYWNLPENKWKRIINSKKQMESVTPMWMEKSLDIVKDLETMGLPFNKENYMKRREEVTKGSMKYKEMAYNYYTLLRKFDFDSELLAEALKTHNHRIVSIEWVKAKEDVYDITVDEVHNFALSNGVIIHNSAKGGRYRDFQGVLALRGKVLNTENKTYAEAMQNEELRTLMTALNCGHGAEYSEEDLHYDKVVIMTDADVDGSHIQTLLLTFFFKHCRKLIENGHVYVVHSPLYAVKNKTTKEIRYAWDRNELNIASEELGGKNLDITRFKGLGEMNAEDLKDTTLNPDNRLLSKITVDDFIESANLFTTLMGDKSERRKVWITQNVEFEEYEDTSFLDFADL